MLLALVCLTIAAPLRAQSMADPTGHWEGAFDLPNFKMPLAFDLARRANGGLEGTMTSATENIDGLPLQTVSLDGRLVHIVIASGSGKGEFSGVLTADGKTISGAFNVNGMSAPIDFTRTGDARIDRPVSAPIGKELEGVWNGVLDVGGKQMRVVLRMVNHPDGTSTGVVINLDGGNIEIPVSAIRQNAANVIVEIRAVGGSYSGTLDANGSELAGTWTERAFSAPLALRRASR